MQYLDPLNLSLNVHEEGFIFRFLLFQSNQGTSN